MAISVAALFASTLDCTVLIFVSKAVSAKSLAVLLATTSDWTL
ncbi:hypothetical protein [Flavobacterium sp. AED]|nr:hypothetical protein [Flavobacterium sp. AED]